MGPRRRGKEIKGMRCPRSLTEARLVGVNQLSRSTGGAIFHMVCAYIVFFKQPASIQIAA